MFRGKRRFFIFGLSVLVVAALVGFLITRESEAPRILHRHGGEASTPKADIVDQTPYRTAVSLQPFASTADEQELAAEAVHLADREVDIAFASALNRAKNTIPPQTPQITEISTRLQNMQGRLQAEQAEVERLTQLAAKPGRNDATVIQQQLELGKAQIGLLQDGIEDAKEDLIRAGGDPASLVQQELEEHENSLQHGKSAPGAAGKPGAFTVEGSLMAQLRTWLRLRQNLQQLQVAQQQAGSYASILATKHAALEKGVSNDIQLGDAVSDTTAPATPAPANSTQHAAKLAKLKNLSQNSKTLSAYDKRIDLEKQLAEVYGDWAAIVSSQIRMAMHAILRSGLWIVLALLALVVAEGALERFYVGVGPNRRPSTVRLTLRFIFQTLGVLVILLVLFGPPSQLSTVLALAGAGLTVALKDFIVAFFGWFILMGKQGIRVGDWVEIDGIGGEVLAVGPLRTILLETGNWNDAGHPTGRRVSFVNSFAVEGHYFNFTTTGQWLWDELDILIPAGEDPYELMNSVMKLVTEMTHNDATLAEEEWRRVTHSSAVQSFSTVPAIEVRPTNLGVNLVIRYIAHAHERHQVRTQLYQAIVELLHSKAREKTASERAATS